MWFHQWCTLLLLLLIIISFVENYAPEHEYYESIYEINPIQAKFKSNENFLEKLKPELFEIMNLNNNRIDKINDAELIMIENFVNDKTSDYETLQNIRDFHKRKSVKRRKVESINHDPKILIILFDNADNNRKKKVTGREGLTITDPTFENTLELKLNHLEPNILRDAYGDACLKVAIRKCYKALIAVSKTVCKIRYKCKSSFRSYFKNKSKQGCINEFDYSKENKGKSNYKSFRGTTFVDATREGYIDACIPYMIQNDKTIHLRNYTPAHNFDTEILRKSSDKKCIKLSRTKCVSACHFTLKETCSKYQCSKRKKKAFKKSCEEQCKNSYRHSKSRASDSSNSRESSDTSSSD